MVVQYRSFPLVFHYYKKSDAEGVGDRCRMERDIDPRGYVGVAFCYQHSEI
jgi:hypothetical protein